MTRARRSILFCVSFLALSALLTHAMASKTPSPQQTLNQYISDLQKNPDDRALRERIIKHVQTMKPAPALPKEAERFEGRAEFAIRNAKTEADFLDAAREYEKALLIAPWVPAYYFNQGIAFEKAGKLEEAKQRFELYLLAAPGAKDARDTRKRIAGLEYAIEKATRESSPAVVAAKKQQAEKEIIKNLDGARYTRSFSTERDTGYWTMDIRGNRIIQGIVITRCNYGCVTGVWNQWDEATLNGLEFALNNDGKRVCSDLQTRAVEKGRINEDGYTITSEECNRTKTYNRER